MDQPYVTIERYDNPIHADLAQMRLEEEGIPVYLHNRNIVWADPLLSNAVGSIKLQVPAEHVERATELVESIRQQIRFVTDKAKPLEDDGCLNCGEAMPEEVDTCAHCGWSYNEPGPA